jgi:pilus assembly protein FimV
MDDPDSARTLLEEIIDGGSSAMREQARKLLDGL